MKLTVFNHKGGVGKTTLTVNIAAALTELGQRVLVVDADPQCNLSSYLLDAEVLDDLLDQSDSADGTTLWSAVQPIVLGIGPVNHIDPVELPIEGAYLIPGDILMSEFETELSDFWTQSIQRKTRGYMGITAISSLVEEICGRLEIDVVLYDIEPNIGPLNRAVILDCDAFVVPVACDISSLRALKTLGRTLSKWIREWSTICELAPSDANLMIGFPRFLGYIPQQFRVYGGVPAREPARLIGEIDKAVRKEISSVLRDLEPSLVAEAGGSPLGQVQEFGALVTAAQHAGTPFWTTPTGDKSQKARAHKAFIELSKAILRRWEEIPNA